MVVVAKGKLRRSRWPRRNASAGDRLVDQVVERASEVSRMAEKQDAMQVRSVVDRLLDKIEKNPLPAEGISIEVQWTVQDENHLKQVVHCRGCEA
jgi:hypothetical protein